MTILESLLDETNPVKGVDVNVKNNDNATPTAIIENVKKTAEEVIPNYDGKSQFEQYKSMIDSIVKKSGENEEEKAKRENRERSNKYVRGIGDVFNSLANLYFTGEGAANVKMPLMTDKYNEEIERSRQFRESNKDRLIKLYSNAANQALGNQFQWDLNSAARVSQSKQAVLDRDFKNSESDKQHEFQYKQAALDRDFRNSESDKQHEFKSKEASSDRLHNRFIENSRQSNENKRFDSKLSQDKSFHNEGKKGSIRQYIKDNYGELLTIPLGSENVQIPSKQIGTVLQSLTSSIVNPSAKEQHEKLNNDGKLSSWYGRVNKAIRDNTTKPEVLQGLLLEGLQFSNYSKRKFKAVASEIMDKYNKEADGAFNIEKDDARSDKRKIYSADRIIDLD